MRVRLLPVLAVMALVATGCATEDVTVDAPFTTPLPIREITLDACVVDQGSVEPATATGEAFTTISSSVLTVGSDIPFPPFEEFENDVPVGFDIDLIREVAARIGELEIEVVGADFETILQDLASGRFDVVVSAVTITQDRKQAVDFTDPYFDADQSLAVRAADLGTVDGVEDLEGRTVGVQAGTTGEDCARNAVEQQYGVREVRAYRTISDAFDDLAGDRVDAVLSDLPTSTHIVDERSGLAVTQRIRTGEKYGVAVSKQNPDLRVAINEALAGIRADGTYDTIFQRWFGTGPPAG